MKFILFLLFVCGVYYFAFGPESTKTTLVSTPEIRTAAKQTTNISFGMMATFVIVVVFGAGLYARTVYQAKTRVKAENELYRMIKDSPDQVTGHDSGVDEAGSYRSVTTRDPYGTDKYWTVVDTDPDK